MKVKPKKCKSVNQKTIGWGCKKLSYERHYGLCNRCYCEWLLKTEEGQKHLDRSKLKGAKKLRKAKAEMEKVKIQKWKKELTDHKKLLQNKCNQIARLIDKGLKCLATQKPMTRINGGHVYSRGSQQSMRYNLHNIHRQSGQSNHYQSDDLKMREGVIREYGLAYMDFLTGLKSTPALKFTKSEYAAFYKKACDIVNTLKRNDRTFNVAERIKERNMVNIHLGIYHLKNSVYGTNKRKEAIL